MNESGRKDVELILKDVYGKVRSSYGRKWRK